MHSFAANSIVFSERASVGDTDVYFFPAIEQLWLVLFLVDELLRIMNIGYRTILSMKEVKEVSR